VNPFLFLVIRSFTRHSVKCQGRALTGSGLASRFVFQLAVRAEVRPLLTVSIAEFLVVGFLNASCAMLAEDLTPCDLTILLNSSGRDAKYLDTQDQDMSIPFDRSTDF
jgi:hypothetical protein